jgi:acyl-CoA synthetase (AMP-forming)/AMP-acid ligase II
MYEAYGLTEASPSVALCRRSMPLKKGSTGVPIPDEKYGEALMAFVVKMPDQDLTESDVIDYAMSRITSFKAPSKVEFVDTLPKSLVGKILKKELRKQVADRG